MTLALSVITCAHNPRTDYLAQVIDALRGQTLDKGSWEYLLIDNASDEPLQSRIDLSWHPNAQHLREEQLGLTHARLRGISEATAEILVFVDDDNVLDTDYLEQVVTVADQWFRIGAFGGQVRPHFEEPPPEWTRPYWSRLVIREFDNDRWTNLPNVDESMPCGAGLCVRRSVASRYVSYHTNGQRSLILDRTGTNLLSGGDTDLAMTACDMGLGVGLFSALKITHLIPRERLEEDYFARLLESLAFSGLVLHSFRENGAIAKEAGLKAQAADFVRMALMDRRQRRFFRAVRRGEQNARKFLNSDNGSSPPQAGVLAG